jgi:protein tyrosine phosphatase
MFYISSWIVAQSPLEGSVSDFWLLVWQSRSPIIVMLTKTYELISVSLSILTNSLSTDNDNGLYLRL